MSQNNSDIEICRRNNLENVLPGLKNLLNTCYPKPPRDVFYRLVEQYRVGFPAYLALTKSGDIVGFAYLAPNSKGGTLESLAVHPEYRNLKLGKRLVKKLLEENPGVIQITTRIPDFFEKLLFKKITLLPDNSYFMIRINF
jgi:N-acetylglutamate synthase-like GNAT family acetyltransferase